MIVVNLQGGLGNQMFQYAAGRSLALHKGTNLCLGLDWFNQEFDHQTTPRHYELNSFCLEKGIRFSKHTITAKLRRRLSHQYNEPHFHFDPGFFSLPKNTILLGYFQSEKYFKKQRDVILKDFSWNNDPVGKNKELVSVIEKDTRSVSVHVRRGDYVTNASAAKFHGVTEVQYYKAAVKQISEQLSRPNLYIFSDDPAWCRKNLKFPFPTTYIAHNTAGIEDMRLMKLCRHNIIANSSFSWWGAWLNVNPSKIVVAPKSWFSHPESNTKDVVPSDWIKL